ncbi:MAG: hypothetical protein IJ678_03285, partial [Kiritimatiellae bacterium]|nr:hypothetical protein [Kiritimatiellia bacterium]
AAALLRLAAAFGVDPGDDARCAAEILPAAFDGLRGIGVATLAVSPEGESGLACAINAEPPQTPINR